MAFDFRKKFISRSAVAETGSLEVYIGIDFGTTYTKVSFQVGGKEGTTKYSLKFYSDCDESDYCLPSVLGYDVKKQSLVFTQVPEEDGLDAVRYFKYSMIEKGVPRNEKVDGQETKNDPQRLCSAFYIAHVLRMVKNHVQNHRAVKGRTNDISWYVNMGVPVADFNAKPKPIYDEALNVAWNLAESGAVKDEMSLVEIDEFYSLYVPHTTWSNRLNTVPELYAELIMFLQDRSVGRGFYAVIDVGGGTVDMAVFFKRIDIYSKKVEISCVSQVVCPLGYELFRNVLDEGVASKTMRSAYGELGVEAYRNHRSEMKKAKENATPLIHFYMGGARAVEFYHDCVNEMIEIHDRAFSCYPGADESDMAKYLESQSNLDVRGNRRLLISQMLAQPFEAMPELAGNPWHFTKTPIHSPAPTLDELRELRYGI